MFFIILHYLLPCKYLYLLQVIKTESKMMFSNIFNYAKFHFFLLSIKFNLLNEWGTFCILNIQIHMTSKDDTFDIFGTKHYGIFIIKRNMLMIG